MKRTGLYSEAIAWIALNDNPGDAEDEDAVSGYITSCLVADLFNTNSLTVARDVIKMREHIAKLEARRKL